MEDHQIRELSLEEIKSASSLIWKSFYHAEKARFSMEGMEKFRDLTSVAVLQYEALFSKTVFSGFFSNGRLLGVIVYKNNHLILLFVDHLCQEKGIGSRLLLHFLSQREAQTVTVNSAPSAVGFYLRHGFEICGEECNEDGILYVPMRKCIQKQRS